jgi:hypothetical protein
VLRFALLLTLLVTPVLAAAYAAGSADRTEFLALVGTVAITPVLAAFASTLSGECVARGAPIVPVAVHAMRSLVPAVLLLAWPNAPLWLIALAVPAVRRSAASFWRSSDDGCAGPGHNRSMRTAWWPTASSRRPPRRA